MPDASNLAIWEIIRLHRTLAVKQAVLIVFLKSVIVMFVDEQ